jgi:hypothetical protein
LILRVLSQIAKLERALDLFGQMDAQLAFQLIQLTLEFLFDFYGHSIIESLVHLVHLIRCNEPMNQ